MKKLLLVLFIIAAGIGAGWLVYSSIGKNTDKPKVPELILNTPQWINQQTVSISGTTDKGVSLLVEAVRNKVNDDGTFTVILSGKDASSRIVRFEVISNSGERTIREVDLTPQQGK